MERQNNEVFLRSINDIKEYREAALSLRSGLFSKFGNKSLGGSSFIVRQTYKKLLPAWVKPYGCEGELFTFNKKLVCTGYKRLVIGDTGAFLELDRDMIVNPIYVRDSHSYSISQSVYKSKEDLSIEFYRQKTPVSYGDFVVGMFYVWVYDVVPSQFFV